MVDTDVNMISILEISEVVEIVRIVHEHGLNLVVLNPSTVRAFVMHMYGTGLPRNFTCVGGCLGACCSSLGSLAGNEYCTCDSNVWELRAARAGPPPGEEPFFVFRLVVLFTLAEPLLRAELAE